MSKRYYVEVSGLGEDGVERLKEAGVCEDSIIVIDDKNNIQPIINAILSATGITFEKICGQDRSRNVMVARLIYVHYATVAGQDRLKIMADIKKNKTMYNWYRTHYDESYQYDKNFKRSVDQVTKILEEDESWMPTRLEKITRKSKRRKKVRRKKKLMKQTQQIKQEHIEEIIDRRQLKIEFK